MPQRIVWHAALVVLQHRVIDAMADNALDVLREMLIVRERVGVEGPWLRRRQRDVRLGDQCVAIKAGAVIVTCGAVAEQILGDRLEPS